MSKTNTVLTGKLRQWNKDKGFGFIGQEKGKENIFIHGSELKNLSRKPKVGDMISYQVITSEAGKNQAINGHIKGVSKDKAKKIKIPSKDAQKIVTFITIFVVVVAIVNLVKYFM
ncbi:MAG: cold shock domain-containing protein [Methyloprofundus sp.]|nr:cold shock domain-containing protein [Methyloprofundus sp.]